MTLKQFLKKYDKKNSIVLLEGKRNVKTEDIVKLISLGRTLASQSKHMIFRSGNAEGSDFYFSQGVCEVDENRLQVITPYTDHRKKANKASKTYSLDTISFVKEPEIIFQTKKNKKMEKLIDQYVDGKRDRLSIKAAYLIRDTIKAIGTEEIPPTTVGLFYDDLDQPLSGGTGHTIQVCLQNNIPVFDQREWFKWI